MWRINFSPVQWQFTFVDGAYEKPDGVAEDNWVCSPQGVINRHKPETWGCVKFVGKW